MSCSSFLRFYPNTLLAGVLTVMVLCGSAKCDDIFWAQAVDGSWTDGINWLDGVPPTFRDDVELGLFAPYVVQLNVFRHANSILISNPNATLELRNGVFLNLITDIENHGQIHIHPEGGDQITELRFESNASLSGDGSVYLGSSLAQINVDLNRLLTNNSPHVIEGEGSINGMIHNYGIINANGAGMLEIEELTINEGTLQASSGGELFLNQSRLEQSPEGMTSVTGADSRVVLDRTGIYGGKVSTDKGGRFVSTNQSGFVEVGIDSELFVEVFGSSSIENSLLQDAEINLYNFIILLSHTKSVINCF